MTTETKTISIHDAIMDAERDELLAIREEIAADADAAICEDTAGTKYRVEEGGAEALAVIDARVAELAV